MYKRQTECSSPRNELASIQISLTHRITGTLQLPPRSGRQRPPTVKGFVSLTMEAEDGLNDVFVRPDVYQRYYKVLRNCFLLTVEGTIQKQKGILNVLAQGAVGM